MQLHEFYKRYANIPLHLRDTHISYEVFNLSTFSDVYKELHILGDMMLPHEIRRDKLLRDVEPFLDKIEKEFTVPCYKDVHNWVDARNEIVKSGMVCTKCGKLRSGND